RELLADLGRRVARAHADRGWRERNAQALGGERDAGERRAEVLLDVDGERAQGGDVKDAAALGLVGDLGVPEAVDGGEECGKRLARPGRREEQRVVATRDRR